MLYYSVSHRNQVAVVSMAGQLELSTLDKIHQCRIELETLPVHLLVLNLAEVTRISEEALQAFALIQSIARASNITLRICGLNNVLLQYLLSRSAIRQNEICSSLLEALKSFDLKKAS